MPQIKALMHALNVGVVDQDKLHRVDLERMRLAAEDQTNLIPNPVGNAQFRPGFGYIATAAGKCKLIPFVAGSSAAYLLELSDSLLRVLYNDALITRPAVTTTVTSGDFSASTGWTLASTSGQSTTVTGGALNLQARAHGGKAIAYQLVTCSGGNVNVEHALRIVVTRGPVTLRVGSTLGGQEYVSETQLATGTHSIAFVPTGNFYVQFSSSDPALKLVDSCTVESAGVMTLPTVWDGLTNPFIVQVAQSLDVMFVACYGKKKQRIERRGNGASAGRSWSVVDDNADDGPWLSGRSNDISLTPSATEGNITITASEPFFNSNMVGGLVRIYHDGQRVDTYLAAANDPSDTIEVTGVNETNYNDRDWAWTLSGTWVGTIRVQRSFDGDDSGFHDFRSAASGSTIDITAPAGPTTNDDAEDNAIAWYRMGFTTYTSGEAHLLMTYDGGGGTGIARITAVASTTSASAEVLTPFQGITASKFWSEGKWSADNGFPTGVAFHEGRLCWLGDDTFDASVSDAYDSFDENTVGDSGPINRSIALGGRNEGRWLLSMSRLFAGTDSVVANIGASSLDEIMTPTNTSIKKVDGANGVEIFQPLALAKDQACYVQQGSKALRVLKYDQTVSGYKSTPFARLSADLFDAGIIGIALQPKVDQQIWVCMDDDDAAFILYDEDEQVLAAIPIATASGDYIQSIAVLPSASADEDRVYASIKRVVNGSTVYYIEKMALRSEARPGNVTKCCDSFLSGTGAHSATINLPHLIGRDVVAWVDGDSVDDADGDPQVFTVDGSGNITLPSAPTLGYCVGLAYRGRFKSARLAYAPNDTTAILSTKSAVQAGFLLSDYCRSGFKFGTQFDNADHPLQSLPAIHSATGATATEVVSGVDRDEEVHPLDGEVDMDARIVFECNSPKPCTVRAIVIGEDIYGG